MKAIQAERGAGGNVGTEAGESRDPFVRLREVLQIHHATAPGRNALDFREHPETLDDCLIATTAGIAPYCLRGPFRWAEYPRIAAAMHSARESGRGHNAPYRREWVFAPVKVVLAETVPIRAALVFEPCYPWQAKLATRQPGMQLWMVYAAVAVLNSQYSKALYEERLSKIRLRSAKPHGLKLEALKRMPVARVDWEYEELAQVADLAHQMIALHEGRVECLDLIQCTLGPGMARRVAEDHYGALFRQQIEAVDERLSRALCTLLGLDETAERALVQPRAVPKGREQGQPTLFGDWDLLPPVPPPPPVRLTGEAESPLRSFGRQVPPEAAQEIQDRLAFWEGAVNSRPPHELYESVAADRPAA